MIAKCFFEKNIIVLRELQKYADLHPSVCKFCVIRHPRHDETTTAEETLVFEEIERIAASRFVRLNQLL